MPHLHHLAKNPAPRRCTPRLLLWWPGSRYYTGHMSTGQTWEINSTSLEDTLALASGIGSRLKGGEVVELVSDLGGGKTTFVRGLAAGAGSADKVHSPSFTISNQYQAGDLTLHHFDFYRLDEAGIITNEIQEVMDDPKAVVIVEWAGIIEGTLPGERLKITIKATGESTRKFIFSYPEDLNYLLKNT